MPLSFIVCICHLRKQDKLTQSRKQNHRTHNHKNITHVSKPMQMVFDQLFKAFRWSTKRPCCMKPWTHCMFLGCYWKNGWLERRRSSLFSGVFWEVLRHAKDDQKSISNRALFYAHCMELDWNYHGVRTTETGLCPNSAWILSGPSLPNVPTATHPTLARLNCWSPLGTGELRFQRNWRCWILRVEPATVILRDFTGQKDDLTRGSSPKYATSCLSSKQFDLSHNPDLVAYWLKFFEVSLDLKKNIHIPYCTIPILDYPILRRSMRTIQFPSHFLQDMLHLKRPIGLRRFVDNKPLSLILFLKGNLLVIQKIPEDS